MTVRRHTLLLIDTSALIHRAYHALPPLATREGEIVNAVYGVAATILAVEKQFAPDYMAAAFDLKGPTFRHKAYDGYKAQRAAAPDDLVAQFGRVRELIDAFGIPAFAAEGFEADDVIGTIAAAVTAAHPEIDVVVVTGDNDALQLVDDRVRVFALRRGITDTVVYDDALVRAKYGLAPVQLPDYKGLAGDASDNIPGVAGIGAKTATKLLQTYGDLEGIYAALDGITGAVHDRLERDRRQAFLSRDLGRIRTDAPIAVSLDGLIVRRDSAAVRAFLGAMNFFSLIKRTDVAADPVSNAAQQGVADEKYVVADVDDVADILAAFAMEPIVGIALDNDGIALSARTGRATYVPLVSAVIPAVAVFLGSGRRARLVAYDLKDLMHVLADRGLALQSPYGDVLLSAYMLHAGSAITLDRLATEVVGETVGDAAGTTQMALIPDPAAAVRAVQRRADIVLRLYAHYDTEIAAVAATQAAGATVADVLERMEIPLVPILASMERAGIGYDAAALTALSDELTRRIGALETAIHTHAGGPFNINSPRQLQVVLFDTLGLSAVGIAKTKTGYSTAASELEKLRDAHPIVGAIEEYRELFKLKTTYVDALPQLVAADGRIHTTFNQAVAATGRLSSTDPNLQNIPVGTDAAARIRAAFVPAEGFMFVSADYSQIDLRCVAHLSGDERMIAAFRQGEDIHTATATEVFGVTASKVTKAMRRQAKALNFGLIYGMGAYGFARSAGIDQGEAQKFIDRYFARFDGVARYMERTIAMAREHGYVQTPYGRRRAVPEIHSPNQQLARSGERMAINMPVQGMTADIMKLAMIAVQREVLDPLGPDVARMVLQVHDEIICEVRADLADTVAAAMKTSMEHVATLRVPLVVDTAVGDSWAAL